MTLRRSNWGVVAAGRNFDASRGSERTRKRAGILQKFTQGLVRNMRRILLEVVAFAALVVASVGLTGCKLKQADAAQEAPPPAKVVGDVDVASWAVDDPSKYPLFTAQAFETAPKLMVTGTVNPDIARTVPVVSLATGRVVEIKARLGDEVKKGQVMLRVRSDDISGGFANYQSAVADEVLAKAQWSEPRSFTSMVRLPSMICRLRMTRNKKPSLR